jgi:hypothetical protein
MSEASITKDFEDINISQRDVKGFNFESRVDTVLNDIGVSYLSNPLDNIKEWKSRQGKGSDFKIPLWNWEIESKYSDGKVFPSWIDRDWIPRFKNGTFRVTVHNRGMKLSTNSLERCFIHDVYLVEIDYLKYVLKAEIKARSRANKLVKAKNSKKELDCSNLEKERSQNNEARTKEKTNGLTFKEISYSSKEISCSEQEFSPSKRLKIVCMNLFLQIKRLALKLWYDRSGNIGVKRIDLKEVLKREEEGVYMNGIRLYPLVSNPVFPCDYYSIGVVPYYDTKHCKHKGVIVCKLKHYKPFYVCRLLLLEKLQKFYQLKDNVFLCSKTVCKDSSSECPYRTIVCKHILKDKACPMIPKCYSKPLPKPKILDSPDLMYYLNKMT